MPTDTQTRRPAHCGDPELRQRYDRAGDYTSGRYSHDDLRIVFARNLERERPRELAEERPLDLEHSLRRVHFIAAWHLCDP